ETDSGWFVKNDIQKIKDVLKHIYELKKKSVLSRKVNQEKIKQYSYQNQSKLLSRFILDLLSQ
ncbi:MAG: hypothetical protein QXY78_04545, partial [Thermoplasmata archaeon]